MDSGSIRGRGNDKSCSSILEDNDLQSDTFRQHYLTYQNSSTAFETYIIAIDSYSMHSTFPEALLISIGESGQGGRVELGLVQGSKRNFTVIFLIS